MINITICGSMKFHKEMLEWKDKLTSKGFNVHVPGSVDELQGYKESGSSKEAVKRKIENNYIRKHYDLIKQSEAILVLNYEKNDTKNYIGGNSLMEMGFAYTLNRDIFLLNPVPKMSYDSEILAMEPVVINNKLTAITDYYKNLPNVYVSSENVIKTSSTSLALREFGYKCNVIGFKTKSGISEQPFTIQETYEGALNRLSDLKKKTKGKKAKFLVSIESGNAILHEKHNTFGLSVCIIENEKKERSITINTDLEIPKSLTDLVPSEYPDLGILVQEKFGVKNKDPYIHFTKGKLNRDRLIFNSVVNTLATL